MVTNLTCWKFAELEGTTVEFLKVGEETVVNQMKRILSECPIKKCFLSYPQELENRDGKN